MRISGLQKLTLLDFPGTVSCILFTEGCNFRCPYCHNSLLVIPGELEKAGGAAMREEDVFAFLRKRQGVLDGVVITGGEPTLHVDLPEMMEKIKGLGYKIKLDTNGTSPEMMERIVKEGLADRIAMDIKDSPDHYGRAAGRDITNNRDIQKSIDFLMGSGIDFEFRTTLVKGIHSEEDVIAMAEWIEGPEEYYIQQFRDSGNLIAPDGLGPFSEGEMEHFKEMIRPYVPKVEIRGL